MAKGTKTKRKGESALKAARGSVVNKREIPWMTIGAVLVVVGLAAAVFTYYLVESAPKREQESREEIAAAYTPSRSNQDPSKKIPGVKIEEYEHRGHVNMPERVAYEQFPPFGGPHDGVWAACVGQVYDQGVRNENMVHSLEHGAVWIAYNPDKLDDAGVQALELRVKNKPFTMLSPYPGLDQPVSLQSWGHQLKLSDPNDQRIDNFIAALRQNQYTTPEPNAGCENPSFDPANPPKFDPSKPGKDAKPMTFDGATGQMPGEGQGGAGAGTPEQQ